MKKSKRITNSFLEPKGWQTCALGKKYCGNVDPVNELPDGLGIILMDDDALYVGEFKQGRRHGRGFMLTLEDHSHMEEYYYRYSYEQVMSTAEFDSCGRVVHTGPGGEWRKEYVEDFRYVKEQDGLWENDVLVCEIDTSVLNKKPWTDYELINSSISYDKGIKINRDRATPIAEVEQGGVLKVNDYTHFITPYGNDGLLVLTGSDKKLPFIVRQDGKPYFDSYFKSDKKPSHFYALTKIGSEYELKEEDCVPKKEEVKMMKYRPFWKETGWKDESDEERLLSVKLKDIEDALKHCNLCRDTLTVYYPDNKMFWFNTTAELMRAFCIKDALEKNIEEHGGYMIDEWQFVDERQSPMDLRSKVKLMPEE
jgi:hypothetical protein